MNWGIKVKKYLEDGNKCKYYGDKACPCVSNKDIRKQYDKRGGFWAIGIPLPECDNCANYAEIDPNITIPISFAHQTLVEMEISLSQHKKVEAERKATKAKEKEKKNTPIHVELLNASGGTAGERLSKAIIGGAFFGSIGTLIGFLGSDESNVKLVFKVDYADGSTKVVVEKANSKAAKNLFSIMNK